MGFPDKLKGDSGPRRYEIAGHIVVCSHCGGEEFDERSALQHRGHDIPWHRRGESPGRTTRLCDVRSQWFLDPE